MLEVGEVGCSSWCRAGPTLPETHIVSVRCASIHSLRPSCAVAYSNINRHAHTPEHTHRPVSSLCQSTAPWSQSRLNSRQSRTARQHYRCVFVCEERTLGACTHSHSVSGSLCTLQCERQSHTCVQPAYMCGLGSSDLGSIEALHPAILHS